MENNPELRISDLQYANGHLLELAGVVGNFELFDKKQRRWFRSVRTAVEREFVTSHNS